MLAVVICCGLIAAPPAEADGPASARDRQAYEAARAGVGRDPDAHVRLALWCEAHGLPAERMKHLAIAVLIDPKHAAARGLMGLVAYGSGWHRPDAVGDKVRADAALAASLAEYNERRAGMANTADAHWDLALWCEREGLKAEATAHFTTVTRLDPGREAAWKRLGCKKHRGRWMTEAQVAAEKAEVDAQKQADKHWRPLLAKWRGWLGNQDKRTEAEKALADVTDPRAVPSIGAVFAGDARGQAVAARMLGQIDAPGSSRALAALAVFAGPAEVRRTATETLRRRDPREFADLLIALVRDPVKYEVRPVGGPGSPGALFVEGKRFNVQRLYAPPPAPYIPMRPDDYVTYDAAGLPVIQRNAGRYTIRNTGRIPADQLLQMMGRGDKVFGDLSPKLPEAFNKPELGEAGRLLNQVLARAQQIDYGSVYGQLAGEIGRVHKAENTPYNGFGFGLELGQQRTLQIPVGAMMVEAQKSAAVAQQQLRNDVAAVEDYNSGVRKTNAQVGQALKDATGEDFGEDREAWKSWWVDQLGYSYKSPGYTDRPTLVENVPLAYQPQPVPVAVALGPPTLSFRRMSCFGARTPVRTLSGTRPIETLRVGDQVLTQDIKSGALSYRPILVVHHNPPSPTFLVKLAGETIVSSPFHRFWVAGRGWVMARDLEAGDTLRMLDGLAEVEAVEPGGVQPVFNLDVAEDHDFFAGSRGALVHDNTLPDLRLAPFDAAPSLAALGRRAN